MKKYLFLVLLLYLTASCKEVLQNKILVNSKKDLYTAIENAKPGDYIILKNGIWKDVAIQFRGKGTKENPISIVAETAGKVSLEGESYLKFGGEYLVVKDLLFQNGYSPSNAVVDFRIDKKEIANNCKLTNCVILDFNKPKRDNSDLWVQFWGRNNELSNSYLAGKTNKGPTVRVSIEGIESINNHHQIINNHFGPRPVKGGPSGETIQLGNSYTSMSPSYTTVANNLFEKCNGEVEIISSKTNFNTFKNNVFYMSEGSLVTRHGNYATIDSNYFIGDGVNENIGGIRIINTGHWVVNNYFYNLIGEHFRSPLAVMNGIPKSPLNRYNQVTDLVVAYNTYVNCKSPWQFGVGQNLAQKEVLPKSEIRSARPIRTAIANNVIYNKKGYKDIVVEHDKADGVTFASNVVDNKGVSFNDFDNGLKAVSLNLKKISDHIQLPTETPNAVKAYKGFDFNTIEKDLFGNSRKNNTSIGATVSTEIQNPNILDKTKYGTSWFSNEVEPREPVTYTVTKAEDIQVKIDAAENGDIINLNFNNSQIDKSIIINKTITITGNGKATLKYNGKKATPLFSLQPKGKLTVEKVILKGSHNNYLFASLQKNMSHHFGLSVSKCEISDFNYVLKVYKESFAERITFKNTSISNCENGLELSEEINDKGDYNTEYLIIDNCTFNTIQKNVIDYYRGGYDESTIGGNLSITNSTFTNSGSKEKNAILLNHRGIINVNLSNNTFKNNKVKLVSLLWGAKNNKASNNTIINSGRIKTEENLKLKLMY